jgi:pimeloyl-ACP methyl ester carboxylesterase
VKAARRPRRPSRALHLLSPRRVRRAPSPEVVRRLEVWTLRLPFALRHIAERSVLKVERGWTWAHDVNVYHRRRSEEIVARRLDCPVFVLLAEHGNTDEAAALLIRRLVPGMSVCVIPQAGHHVMLDQPLALIGLLRLIADLLISGATAPRESEP